MNDMLCRKISTGGYDGLAGRKAVGISSRAKVTAFGQNLGAAATMDRAIDTASAE